MKHKNRYQERLNKVLTYIEKNLDERISLDFMAKYAYFSPYHFHRIFLGMTGETIKSYIRRLKLQRAANRLIFTKNPITNIAFEAGYNSLESFSRAFKLFYNLSPSKYRLDIKQAIEIKPIIRRTPMNVTIKPFKLTTIAYVRHIGPYEECEPAWGKIINWATHNNYISDAAFIGVCHDDPEITDPKKIRFDVAISVPKSTKPQGEIQIATIEQAKCAHAIHKGSYKNLKDSYAYLCGKWAVDNNQEIDAKPSIEVYLNDPHTTKEDELLTEIYLPLIPTQSKY